MKDYKKILEGVVNIINTAEEFDIGFDNICAYIDENCPELKESSDDTTRNSLINFLKSPFVHENITDEKVAPWIVWLEKQDKQKPIDYDELKKCRENPLYFIDKYVKLENKQPVWSEEDEQSKNWILEYLYDGLRRTDEQFKDEFKAAIDWLDKLGEQKSIDNVEPKFHEGDWIINQEGKCYRIKSIYNVDDGYYIATDKDGEDNRICFGIANEYFHLWTVKDAKCGDVLISSSYKQPFVYNGNYTCDSLGGYFGLSHQCELLIGDSNDNHDNNWTKLKGVQPATKEQCNMLFKKLHDSDYKWDSEKKELWHKYLYL